MLVFVTAVKHPNNSQSYGKVWRLLNRTLYSVCSQSDQRIRVIVVCDKKLPLFHHKELINKYTDFVEVDFPSHGDEVIKNFNRLGNFSSPIENPKRWKQWSRDTKKSPNKINEKLWKFIRNLVRWATKGKYPQNNISKQNNMSKDESKLMANYAINRSSKQLVGILAAKKYDPEYVLTFDADDYVGNDISTYVNTHPGENGWLMTHGYKMMDNLISPFYSKNSFCGTGNIFNYSLLLEDISPEVNERSTQNELFEYVDSEFLITLARHGKVRSYYEKKDQPFLDYPSRSAVHLLGHEESNDFQRRTIRGEPISARLETAQKYAEFSPITPSLVNYFNILPKNTPKVFCVGFNETGINTVQAVLKDMGYQVAKSYWISDIEFCEKLENGDISDIRQDSEMFDAFQDAPWFLFYKEFDQWYPGSKFILTTRDSSSWLKSFQNYFRMDKPLFKYVYGFDNPIGHEEIFVERFERHNREVIEYFKDRPDDLLMVDVSEDKALQKISTFLGKRTTYAKMPHANARLQNGESSPKRPMIRPINTLSIKTTNTGGRGQGRVNFSIELTPASLRYQKIAAYLAGRSFYASDIQYNLTISQEKQFVWFRVAKVGTRTILDIFNQANVDLSAEHPYDCYYPVNMYKDYFRFAFVRNPWDRFVSCWQNKVVDRNMLAPYIELQEFENYVDYIARNIDLEYGNRHLRLQSRLIDLNHIDYLGRYETFQEDLEEVMDIIGIEAIIKRKNASKRKEDYREYYTASTKNKVAELYKRDIKIFNYEF